MCMRSSWVSCLRKNKIYIYDWRTYSLECHKRASTVLIIKIKYVSKLGRLRDTFVDIYNTVGKCYYVEIIVRTHIHKQYPLGERFEFLFRVITTVALMCIENRRCAAIDLSIGSKQCENWNVRERTSNMRNTSVQLIDARTRNRHGSLSKEFQLNLSRGRSSALFSFQF